MDSEKKKKLADHAMCNLEFYWEKLAKIDEVADALQFKSIQKNYLLYGSS